MTKHILAIFTIFIISKSINAFNFFSPIIKTESFYVTDYERHFDLKHKNLIVNSEKIIQDSIFLIKNIDYKIDHRNGTIDILHFLGKISLEYKIFPENLSDNFYLYKVQTYSDSTEINIPKNKKRFYSEANLNITGSKTIAISVASNEDFGIDQSLFLRINGDLSRNMRIEAQLSDSQSPITPEGDSRELSSLDQIYLKLFGKQYELAFGDLEMEFKNTNFLKYSPKFEGVKAGWFGRNELLGALAISKGKKAATSFYGVEAKQGPYYLSIENTGGIQVVPGTEEIFLNGEKMQRGKDYSIDYSEGSLTFSNDHFISSKSYIFASFQYSDENYRQNIYLTSAKLNLFEKLEIRNSIIIQNDDKKNPLQELLSEEDMDSLRFAGDGEAWGRGVFQVEAGEGSHILVGDDFIFAGSDSTGNYNLRATFVNLDGDYNRIQNDDETGYNYIYNPGNGNYVLKKELTAPENKANYDLNLKYTGKYFNLEAEGIFSIFDKNSFSDFDKTDDEGYGFQFGTSIFPDYDHVNPEFTFYYRILSKHLFTFAEIDDARDNYELIQLPDSLSTEEFNLEVSFDFYDLYSPQINYRKKTARDFAEQDYLSISSNLKQKWAFPNIFHRFLIWKQIFHDPSYFHQAINFEQHFIQSFYKIKKYKFGVEHLSKKTIIDFRYFPKEGEFIRNSELYFSFASKKTLTSKIYFKQEISDSLNFSDSWEKSNNTNTVGINSFLSSKDHRIKLDILHREIKEDELKKFDLAEITIKNSFLKEFIKFNSRYSLKNLEFYPKIRELIEVSYGIYDSTGIVDVDGDGGYDWIITDIDYDNPQMSIEVNADFSTILNPKLITKTFLKKFQTETYWLVTENSISEKKLQVYLLQPEILMNSETTKYGSNNFRQNIWFNISPGKLITGLEYRNNEILDKRYNNESERRTERNWEGMIRILNLKNSNIEASINNLKEDDSFYNSETVINSVDLDVRNKLSKNLTLSSLLEFSNEKTNKGGEEEVFTIDSYNLTETITYFFKRKYRIFSKLTYKRNNRKGSSYLSFLADKKNGNIFKWNLNFDYKVNSYTSASLKYSGDSYPGRDDVHKIEVEVKAEF